MRDLGFTPVQCRAPGLLLPLWTTDGSPGFAVYRPDNPRVHEQKNRRPNPDGTYPCKVVKYEIPKGQGVRLDCPPTCHRLLADPQVPLWVTEGQKKADALASLGLAAIALLGAWNFLGKNEQGSSLFLADWDTIPLHNREVRIIFDSDVMRKRPVQQALDRLRAHLQRKCAQVDCVYLPFGAGGEKLGVDDWLAQGHTLAELEQLVEAPRPAPRPAPDQIKLLDQSPASMTRPLTLLDRQAYAATWQYVQVTKTEDVNKQGEIVQLRPPVVTTETRLFILRGDGVLFGDGADHPFSDLNLTFRLPEIPPDDRIWKAAGVKAYLSGRRADPKVVFSQLAANVDFFIDFDRSFAPQSSLVEMVVCYILSTWFLDAFNVVGYLWPNGDRGSGKTNLLSIITQLSYLGMLILASGSFASLRDMADYGATLAFDDAEILANPKNTDPDKRALLLAGNRRGTQVPVKEFGDDKKWRTRYVNAFCPRLFSAIRLPDPILASRTLVIPLVRTADRRRANSDPEDHITWPHHPAGLVDDCWALALERLPELPEIDRWVGKNARLAGRSLQPWRSILAMARWLELNGVHGIWPRMEQISLDYQKERSELETTDLTGLVIRALAGCVSCDMSDVSDISDINIEKNQILLLTADITQEVIRIVKSEEIDFDPDLITPRRVGRILGKLRLVKSRFPGKGTRQWMVSVHEIKRLASSYGLLASKEQTPEINVTNVTNVTDVTPSTGLESTGAES